MIRRPGRLAALASCALLSGCLLLTEEVPPQSVELQATSPRQLFELLEDAYETRSVSLLETLLADDYTFDADERSLSDVLHNTWGKQEEIDRHRRMFRAISNVRMLMRWDSLGVPSGAPGESTWTVYTMDMEMEYEGKDWLVSGRADFQLRATRVGDTTSLYRIVRWSDINY